MDQFYLRCEKKRERERGEKMGRKSISEVKCASCGAVVRNRYGKICPNCGGEPDI
jgi:hypothetical protein